MTTTTPRAYLPDICIMRLLLIVLLVAYHAFAPYMGRWEVEISDNPSYTRAYYWLGALSYSFMLETFTFISGLIFGTQINAKGIEVCCGSTSIARKVRRLIVPSIFFSLIYIVIYPGEPVSVGRYVYNIVAGICHMWYLPMLFWCFVVMSVLTRWRLSDGAIIAIALVATPLYVLDLPLQLSPAAYYFVFFSVGCYIGKHKAQIDCRVSAATTAIAFVLYAGAFVAFNLSDVYGVVSNAASGLIGPEAADYVGSVAYRTGVMVYSAFGVAFIYSLINLIVRLWHIRPSQTMVRLSGYCFGVYIYQQFILVWLYKHTGLALLAGPLLTPWVAIAVALAASLLLTRLTLSSRLGRMLLG